MRFTGPGFRLLRKVLTPSVSLYKISVKIIKLASCGCCRDQVRHRRWEKSSVNQLNPVPLMLLVMLPFTLLLMHRCLYPIQSETAIVKTQGQFLTNQPLWFHKIGIKVRLWLYYWACIITGWPSPVSPYCNSKSIGRAKRTASLTSSPGHPAPGFHDLPGSQGHVLCLPTVIWSFQASSTHNGV